MELQRKLLPRVNQLLPWEKRVSTPKWQNPETKPMRECQSSLQASSWAQGLEGEEGGEELLLPSALPLPLYQPLSPSPRASSQASARVPYQRLFCSQ